MFRITAGNRRLCDGLSRRDVLRVGGAGLLGLSLPDLLRADSGKGRAKSLIVFALEGGPAGQDLWDMKPDAPVGVRGEFDSSPRPCPASSSASTCPCSPGRPTTSRSSARSTTPSATTTRGRITP